MQLSSLNKEYQLVRQENIDKFIKLSEVNPKIAVVEEYWITSDETMGNRCAYFEGYKQAEEFSSQLAASRSALNVNNSKPFMVLINGREVTKEGHLEDFLAGKFALAK